VPRSLPEEFNGTRDADEALADLQALDGQEIRASVAVPDQDAPLAWISGRARITVVGTPPTHVELTFSGRAPEIQHAEYLANRRFPMVDAALAIPLADFQEATLQTADGNDHFLLEVTTGGLRLVLTEH
jgi:hypothetical protein